MRKGNQNNNTVKRKIVGGSRPHWDESVLRMDVLLLLHLSSHPQNLTKSPSSSNALAWNHTEAAMFSNVIWGRPHSIIYTTDDNQVGRHSSPSSGSFWTLQSGNYFSNISILPIWNVSYPLWLRYSFLNPFSLSDSFIHSFLLGYFALTTLLSLLVFPLFSNNHSSTLHSVPF